MIIKKEESNTYKIKLYEEINIYDINTLKDIIKLLLKKIQKKHRLRKQVVLDIYLSKFETIIILKDYNNLINTPITEVKINIHTNTTILYEIDYLNTKNKLKGIIYYYKNKFYIEPKNISKESHIHLLEYINIVYDNTDKILDDGLKIKI